MFFCRVSFVFRLSYDIFIEFHVFLWFPDTEKEIGVGSEVISGFFPVKTVAPHPDFFSMAVFSYAIRYLSHVAHVSLWFFMVFHCFSLFWNSLRWFLNGLQIPAGAFLIFPMFFDVFCRVSFVFRLYYYISIEFQVFLMVPTHWKRNGGGVRDHFWFLSR